MEKIGASLAKAITAILLTAVLACHNRRAEDSGRNVDSSTYLNSVKEIKGNTEEFLIVPGSKVGKVRIGMNSEELIRAIG